MSSNLSQTTIDTVKATVPFLHENATALTEHFYERMFNGNPEVKALFNASNQASGTQQRALAGAICAFAENIENPEVLSAAVTRISNKHASLGIKPEHYPIVGDHLLGAIDDLLNPAPPEVLSAWTDAYQFLADIMIETEKTLYSKVDQQPGGWTGFREFEVFKRESESQWITSFYLRPKDGKPIAPFRAGQYITLRLPTPDGSTTMRNYSLSGSPDWDHYRISVKREIPRHADTPEGFVSSYLHTKVSADSLLEVGPPFGDFFLQDHAPTTPILLLSGGVGLTPLLSMLHSCIARQLANPIIFLHAAINGQHHAMRDEVNELARSRENISVHFRYSAPTDEDKAQEAHHSEGLCDSAFLRDYVSPETEIYFCGPKPMMIHIYKALKDFEHPVEKIHYEFFGPQEELEH